MFPAKLTGNPGCYLARAIRGEPEQRGKICKYNYQEEVTMITMEHVCKSYKVAKRNAGFKEACKSLMKRETEEIQALSDVSFTIGDGEMVGYIGPNGAGKSSTIKILGGILTPDSGSCVIDGRVPWKNRLEVKP